MHCDACMQVHIAGGACIYAIYACTYAWKCVVPFVVGCMHAMHVHMAARVYARMYVMSAMRGRHVLMEYMRARTYACNASYYGAM